MNTIIVIIVLLVKKNPVCPDYSALSEEFDSSHKTYKFEVFDRFRITKYKNNFSKD